MLIKRRHCLDIYEYIRQTDAKIISEEIPKKKLKEDRYMGTGENPNRVFVTGSLGVDKLRNTKLLSKKLVEKKMKFKFNKRNILITYHPVTLEKNTSASQFKEILSAISKLKDTKLI